MACRAFPSITIGSDPEVFITNGQQLISAIDVIGGTKTHPRPLAPNDRKGYFWLEDNVALEFNIPPAKTVEEFVDSIEWSMSEIKDRLADENYFIAIEPSVLFPKEELDRDPRSQVFGCSPDYNAWTGHINPKPIGHSRLRAAGGHIHIGYLENYRHNANARNIVRAMDLFLGVPSVLMDDDTDRRSMYGKAGAWRPQPHGLEYRVLSNFWLRSKEKMAWAYTQTMRAFQSSLDSPTLAANLEQKITNCINNSDMDLAQELAETYQLATV